MSKIITFTGASGSGKSSIVKEILKLPNYKLITSTTTRQKRLTDLPEEYNYIPMEAFEDLDKKNKFAWCTGLVHGNRYGTEKICLEEAVKNDYNSLMILIPEVLPILYSIVQNKLIIPIYIKLPSEKILRERLKERKDDQKEIEKRILECKDYDIKIESQNVPYIKITNEGAIEETKNQVLKII